ncbi:uncharacterized protein [Amphiura filiformis]|uniref:uncharacterized protein isoform X3 n=1 Tax=Amphiura filiformis TaxID=82378 RepID=UPI003B215E18
MNSNRRQLAINSSPNSEPNGMQCRVILLCTCVISLVIILLVVIAGLIIGLANGSSGSTGSGSGSGGSQTGTVRLNPQQMANLEANYARLIADMGGVFRPELLSEPEFYTRDLIGGFTAEQEQQFLSSCGNPDVFRPRSNLNAIPEGDTSFGIFTSFVTQRVQIPFNRRKRQTSRVCPGTASQNTNLVTVTGQAAQLFHLNDHIQWVFNEECSGNSCQSVSCTCSKIEREVSAHVFIVDTDTPSTDAVWKTVTIYSCSATI